MRASRSFLVLLLLVAASLFTAASPASAQQSRLVDVRVGHHPGFDRIVFEFSGPLPSSHSVRYIDHLVADGSGKRVRVAGAAILGVVMRDTVAHDDRGRPTALRREAYATPNVMTVVMGGDFESVVSYGVGLAKREPFRVTTLRSPARLVIDVETTFRRVTKKIWFLDADAYASGSSPYRVSVARRVPAAAPAAGVLHRLYAGPTKSERADSLRLVRSRTTGFSHLTIADEVADLRLLGRCSSGGATFTIADLVMPALKQFDSVRWVKIRDRHGATQMPGGNRDSIPTCLEP